MPADDEVGSFDPRYIPVLHGAALLPLQHALVRAQVAVRLVQTEVQGPPGAVLSHEHMETLDTAIAAVRTLTQAMDDYAHFCRGAMFAIDAAEYQAGLVVTIEFSIGLLASSDVSLRAFFQSVLDICQAKV